MIAKDPDCTIIFRIPNNLYIFNLKIASDITISVLTVKEELELSKSSSWQYVKPIAFPFIVQASINPASFSLCILATELRLHLK